MKDMERLIPGQGFYEGKQLFVPPAYTKQEYESLVHQLMSIEDRDELQAIFNNDLKGNFLINDISRHNTPLFISLSRAVFVAHGISTIIRGQKADKLKQKLYESEIPVAESDYSIQSRDSDYKLRGILLKHMPRFKIASQEFVDDHFNNPQRDNSVFIRYSYTPKSPRRDFYWGYSIEELKRLEELRAQRDQSSEE